MSYVIVEPDFITAAAADLATIGSTLDDAHSAAAPTTIAVAPAAADEVSVSIAHVFSRHALDYQSVARHAAASQEQFVQNLKTSAASYTSIEDAIASFLQRLGLDPSVPPGSVLYDVLGQTISIVAGFAVLAFFASLVVISLAIATVRAIIAAITGVIAG